MWGVQGMESWENRHGREVGGRVLKRYSAQYFAIEKKAKKKGREAGVQGTQLHVREVGGLDPPPGPSHMLLLSQRYHFLLRRVIVIIITIPAVNLCLTSDGHLHL